MRSHFIIDSKVKTYNDCTKKKFHTSAVNVFEFFCASLYTDWQIDLRKKCQVAFLFFVYLKYNIWTFCYYFF